MGAAAISVSPFASMAIDPSGKVLGANDKIRIGMIGVNSRGKGIASGLAKLPECEITYICDVGSRAIAKCQEVVFKITGKTPKGERDLRVMLASPEVDAVVIATPDHWHAPAAIMAMQAGKHVLCEKPMAFNAKQAQEMKDAADKAGKLLMIGFVRRYGNDCKVMKDFVNADYFGDIYYAKATYLRRHGSPGGWFSNIELSGGGPLIDIGVHMLDAAADHHVALQLTGQMAVGIDALIFAAQPYAFDACLFNSQNFSFVRLPKECTTGSSIMPHKKNPDVFELTRAKCNKLQTLPQQIMMIMNNLPSGYFRDLQIIKEVFLPAFQELRDCLQMSAYIIRKMEVNEEILSDPRYDLMFSVEEVNRLATEGMPFRDAYKKVGLDIEAGNFTPDKNIRHTHEGSIGNLCNGEIARLMDSLVGEFHFERIDKAVEALLA